MVKLQKVSRLSCQSRHYDEDLPSSDQVGARFQQIFDVRSLAGLDDLVGQSCDCKDGANRHTSVQVARTIDRVAGHDVMCVGVFVKVYHVFLLLGNQSPTLARSTHGRDEEIVGYDIKLLLVVASDVRGAGQASEVDQSCSTDVVRDRLEGELESLAEEATHLWSAR